MTLEEKTAELENLIASIHICRTCRFWDADNWMKDLQCRCFNKANQQKDFIFVSAPFYSCEHWQQEKLE